MTYGQNYSYSMHIKNTGASRLDNSVMYDKLLINTDAAGNAIGSNAYQVTSLSLPSNAPVGSNIFYHT